MSMDPAPRLGVCSQAASLTTVSRVVAAPRRSTSPAAMGAQGRTLLAAVAIPWAAGQMLRPVA
jgi:hypothetical protein